MKTEQLTETAGWRLDLGAQVVEAGVRFRVWAPKCRSVEAVLQPGGEAHLLSREANGFFIGFAAGVRPGALYRYRLDQGQSYPDPCSRYQPEGPDGPSMVVDSGAFEWHDRGRTGVTMHGQVIYELHIGAFTAEGTFDAAARQLPELKRLGITLLNVMPIAEFAGRHNWGYDGVGLYAPEHAYGDAHAFRRFVDAAHGLGLGVILDVVYNHLGPDGNHLHAFADDYFTGKYENDWGEAINFEGPRPVREFFIQNACYWVSEFHVDGLRLDATQDIFDASPVHVLAEISRRAREAAGGRSIVLVAENEPQQCRRCLAPLERGGYGLDAMWNDDFHHAARVALTGFRQAYYTDYRGTPQELISTVRHGFLYQGQRYQWQKKNRGSPALHTPAQSFITYLENHDQVANQITGERMNRLTSPARLRAMTALLLLAPETPMLFMGQEFGASSPFLYFTDHREALAHGITEGRRDFLSQFPSYSSPESRARIAAPNDEATFLASKLDVREREKHACIYALHEHLLRIRRDDPLVAMQRCDRIEGAVLGPAALVLRYFGEEDGDDRLLVLNLGTQFDYAPAPEPLLAPPEGRAWELVWSSNDVRYGGPGVLNPLSEAGWMIPAECAVWLSAKSE